MTTTHDLGHFRLDDFDEIRYEHVNRCAPEVVFIQNFEIFSVRVVYPSKLLKWTYWVPPIAISYRSGDTL